MAGTATLIISDATSKSRFEVWEVTTDGGVNPVAIIYTHLSNVVGVSSAWLEDIGEALANTYAVVPEFVIDNALHTVTITLAYGVDIDKKMSVTLISNAT